MQYPYENLENFTIGALWQRSLGMYSKNPSLAWVGEEAMSYEKMGAKIDAMKALLKANGIHKGDKVLLLSENMPHWGVAYISITSLGAVVVPVLPDFHPAEVHHILRHSEAKAVFVSSKYQSTIEDAPSSDVEFVINLDTLTLLEDISNKSYLSQFKQKMKEKMHKHDASKVDEEDLCAIIYTSGTTGHSKGVMLTHKNIVTNAMSSHSVLEITSQDTFLSVLPLAHTFECTVGLIVPLLHGSSVYYVAKTPTPSVLLKAFELVRPTMMLSVPLIIEKIYKNKVLAKFNSSFLTKNLYKIAFFRKQLNKIAGKKLLETFGGRLRFFGIGGAALSPFVEQFLLEADFPYVVGYGLTETAPLLAGTPLEKTKKLKSTGPAMYGVTLMIKDADVHGEGEICAKSPSVMRGYYKDEEKTKEVFDEDDWFLTGDLGYIDEDGYLFISGRSKNVIISASGENIYPEQIESVINQDELVADALVMEMDGKVVARVYFEQELLDEKLNALHIADSQAPKEIQKLLEEMRQEVNEQLSSFSKVSRFIHQAEPFVKTPTKKIKRYLYAE